MINKKGGIKNRKRMKEIKGSWHGYGAISTVTNIFHPGKTPATRDGDEKHGDHPNYDIRSMLQIRYFLTLSIGTVLVRHSYLFL